MGKLWLNNEIVDRLAMLQQTEVGHPGVNQVAIEKDWWVTVTLKALFQTDCRDSLIFKGETSIAKVSLSKPTDDTLGWLYEYLRKLYKEPLYNSESCVQEQYKNLFTDIDGRETPLCIWQTANSLIALIHWYDTDEDITQYYIKAEPIK